MLEAVDLYGERGQEEGGVALEEHLGVRLAVHGAARLVHLDHVVVRGQVLLGEQLRIEVDLSLEARSGGADLC